MAGQPIQVGEQQRGPLVGGEPPGEADRQDVGVEHVAGGFDHLVAFAAAAALAADAAAHERQQQILQRIVRLPQFARIHAVDVLPGFRLAHAAGSSRPGSAGRTAAASARPASWDCGRRW